MFKKKRNKTLVISFFSGELRILEGKWMKNGFTELKAETFTMPEGLIEDGRILDMMRLTDFVRVSVQKGKFSSKDAALVFNSSEIAVREITIPKVPDEEINSIVGFKVAEMFPQGDDMDIGHVVAKTIVEDEVEKYILLVIAIPRDMVLSYFNLFEQIGLEPDIMEYQPNASAKYLGSSKILKEDEVEEPIGILDINNKETSFSIVSESHLEAARYIPFGIETLVQNITQLFMYDSQRVRELLLEIPDINAEYEDFSDESRFLNAVKTSLSGMLEEIEQVVRFYNSRRGNKPVRAILLTGSGIGLNKLDEYISKYFQIPVRYIESEHKNIDSKLFISLMGSLIQ